MNHKKKTQNKISKIKCNYTKNHNKYKQTKLFKKAEIIRVNKNNQEYDTFER